MIKKFEQYNKELPEVIIDYKNGQKIYEYWFLNVKLHREDGPAIQGWYKNGEKIIDSWYLENNYYSKEEWIEGLKDIGSEHYEEQKMLYNAEKYNL